MHISHIYLCSLYHSWQFDTIYSYIFYVFGTVVHSEGDQLEMFKGDTQNLWSARKYHTYIYVLYVIAGNLTPFIHTFFYVFGTIVHLEGDQLEMCKGDTQNLWCACKYHTDIYVLYVIAGNLTPFIYTFLLRHENLMSVM